MDGSLEQWLAEDIERLRVREADNLMTMRLLRKRFESLFGNTDNTEKLENIMQVYYSYKSLNVQIAELMAKVDDQLTRLS